MDVHVAIVGTGFTGLGAAIQLRAHGITDVVLLERAGDLGGTWRDNRYPGCACDVPSHLYSFSFAHNPDWTQRFSPQPEIQRYLRKVADRHGVTSCIRFHHALRSARWNGDGQRWELDTAGGPLSARVLVLATGALSDPVTPDLPGLAAFEGPVFHSAKWRDDVDLTGQRVAVIGTGASAIQFVPAIQPQVQQLTLFQRTPPWIVPRHNRRISGVERALYRALPPLQTLVRGATYALREATFLSFRHRGVRNLTRHVALRHLAKQVRDPELRARLTPSYEMGCKRILVSDDFYPAVAQPNVSLVTERVQQVEAQGLVTHDGVRHVADVLILGTGFRATDPPLGPHIRGRNGVTLRDAWGKLPGAYASTTVHGFPNLFVIPGPNAGIGHTSLVYMIESQIEHLVQALEHQREHGLATLEPTYHAQDAWMRDVKQRMQRMVWLQGGCRSWYLDAQGHNSTLWPDFTFRFRRVVAAFDARAYHGDPLRHPTHHEGLPHAG
jgi:cation diffusion facilitator CzcD-associated flavoprotein CzcO